MTSRQPGTPELGLVEEQRLGKAQGGISVGHSPLRGKASGCVWQ